MALSLDAQILALDARQRRRRRRAGFGELTVLTLHVEVMDWRRFGNRKQAASYNPTQFTKLPS